MLQYISLKFVQSEPSCYRRAERRNEANSRFSKICECAKKPVTWSGWNSSFFLDECCIHTFIHINVYIHRRAQHFFYSTLVAHGELLSKVVQQFYVVLSITTIILPLSAGTIIRLLEGNFCFRCYRIYNCRLCRWPWDLYERNIKVFFSVPRKVFCVIVSSNLMTFLVSTVRLAK